MSVVVYLLGALETATCRYSLVSPLLTVTHMLYKWSGIVDVIASGSIINTYQGTGSQ